MKFVVGYFYPSLLNLYGDSGNVEILVKRAEMRGYETEVVRVEKDFTLNAEVMKSFNVVFIGGGPDSGQKLVHRDLLDSKGPYIKEYVENGGVGLFVCGSYQLLGNYYRSSDGEELEGLGLFDLHTEHFGNKKSRCIGNVVCEISEELRVDPVFNAVNKIGSYLVGFENHGGRTYLGDRSLPLAKVVSGHGNNSEDGTEGILYKNCVGTYLHGPVLAPNPHLADYLIAKGLGVDLLQELNDDIIINAHAASKKLKQ
jgi:lipid II isoglutaminyl synthase (glutamine-hydrolysing)